MPSFDEIKVPIRFETEGLEQLTSNLDEAKKSTAGLAAATEQSAQRQKRANKTAADSQDQLSAGAKKLGGQTQKMAGVLNQTSGVMEKLGGATGQTNKKLSAMLGLVSSGAQAFATGGIWAAGITLAIGLIAHFADGVEDATTAIERQESEIERWEQKITAFERRRAEAAGRMEQDRFRATRASLQEVIARSTLSGDRDAVQSARAELEGLEISYRRFLEDQSRLNAQIKAKERETANVRAAIADGDFGPSLAGQGNNRVQRRGRSTSDILGDQRDDLRRLRDIQNGEQLGTLDLVEEASRDKDYRNDLAGSDEGLANARKRYAENIRRAEEASQRRVDQIGQAAKAFEGAWDSSLTNIIEKWEDLTAVVGDTGTQIDATSIAAQGTLNNLKDFVGGELKGAVESHVGAWVNGSESIGQALKGLAKDAITSLAVRAIVEGLANTAQGFAAIASYRYDAASAYFTSAAIWAGVGAAAGGAAAALGATSSGGSGGRATIAPTGGVQSMRGNTENMPQQIIQMNYYAPVFDRDAEMGRAMKEFKKASDRRYS